MFGTIRRHQSWLWIIIAGITIISFVVFFGPNGSKLFNGVGGGKGSGYGTLAGSNITPEQYHSALNEVYISYFLQNNAWPDRASEARTGFSETRETYIRLFLIQKQKDLGIDIITPAVVAHAKQMLGTMPLAEFVDRILKPQRMDSEDFENYIRHDLGIRQLYQVTALSGTLVTPQEAESLYRNENRDIVASAAVFSSSNYLSQITTTPAQVAQFYTNQLNNYQTPSRIEVEYVKYDVTNYLAAAKTSTTNLDQIIDQNYSKLATNAESRAKLKEELVRSHALEDASKVANRFVGAVYDQQGTNRLAQFGDLAKASNLTVRALAPFDSTQGPAELKVGANFMPNFVRQAFQLSSDTPISGTIPGEDGIYVLALKRIIAPEIPPLAGIEAKVTKDYREAMAYQLAQQSAIAFDATLTNGLAQGKTFEALCIAAKVKAEALPHFSLTTQTLPEMEDRFNFRVLKQVAFGTPPGNASRPAPTRDGAFVLYVDKLLPVDEAKMKKEIPEFIIMMRRGRENDAFNQWIQKQVNLDPAFGAALQSAMESSQPGAGGTGKRKS